MSSEISLDQATTAAADPTTSGKALQEIATHYRALWPKIAAHPNAYPDLLAWLNEVGDDQVKAAVAARLQEPNTITAAITPPTTPPPVAQPLPQTMLPPMAPAYQQPMMRPVMPMPMPVPFSISSNARAGASTAGAVVGGLLVMLVGLSQIIDYSVSGIYRGDVSGVHLTFGTLPSVNSVIGSCNFDCYYSGLQLFSGISTGIVWLALGIAIMAAARRRLTGVAIFGFICLVLLVTEPFVEIAVAYPYNLSQPFNWLYILSMPILLPAAVLLVALACRPNRSCQMLKIVALVLLIVSLVVFVGYGIWASHLYVNWILVLNVAAPVVFGLGWIIVTATIRNQSPPQYPPGTPMWTQPAWQPSMVPQQYYLPPSQAPTFR